MEKDAQEGSTDYCLWSTFRPECIDTDKNDVIQLMSF